MPQLRFSVLFALQIYLTSLSTLGAMEPFYIEGDAIGEDGTLTNGTGGFTAVQQGAQNLGQPAIQVAMTGSEFLKEFRVIVFGLPGADGNLFFQEFDYRLDVWKREDYFAGAEPEFNIELGDPVGVELVPLGATSVVPNTVFGSAGSLAGNADTYDLHFNLTNLPTGGEAQDLFMSPLAAGDWVLGFQSWHDTQANGTLRVTGSIAAEGPLPLFSRDDSVPRGILGEQDPLNIGLRWGISLTASDVMPGDFDLNSVVDENDLTQWQSSFAVDPSADADADSDSDGVDYLIWQLNKSGSETVELRVVPEPLSTVGYALLGYLLSLPLRRADK